MKYTTLVFLFISWAGFSQAPDAFKYQGVVHNASGLPIADKDISVRIGILSGTVSGPSVYAELHSVKTSSNGSFNLDIGKGAAISGAFSTINWGVNTYFVKIEMDVDKDNTFENVGTSQLLAVPYALYANKSGSELWEKSTNNNIFYSKGWVGIGTSSPAETLHINGNIRGNQNGAVRINTVNGYLDVGPKNADYAHFYTNMPYGFYFGGNVTVREHLIGYKESDLHISTESNTTFQPVKRISILNSNGYVGIAKTNPQYALDVNGTVNATSFLVNGQPLSSASSVWSVSGANAYYSAGNVGIGTSSPQETLHINGNIRGNQNGAIRINTANGYLDVGPKNADYAHFYTNLPYGFYFGGNVTVREHLIGYKDFDLHLSTESNIDFQPVKRISILNSNGYVGIGTTQPKTQLQIESGDVYLNTVGSGVIMKSPSNQCWRLTVSDSGTPVFTAITCP